MGQAIATARPFHDLPAAVPGSAPDFRDLLGEAAWARLPAAVQRRFDTASHHGVRRYPGRMTVEASPVGLCFAWACRLIGSPLASSTGHAVPVTVEVYPDHEGAQVWDRTYAFPGHNPQKVSSRKKMDGHRRLMEVVRGGLGMTLAISVEDGALHFRSRSYFLLAGAVRLPIPLLLTPGAAHVIHADVGGGVFRFTLSFEHPWFGRTLFQTGLFNDPRPAPEGGVR